MVETPTVWLISDTIFNFKGPLDTDRIISVCLLQGSTLSAVSERAFILFVGAWADDFQMMYNTHGLCVCV